MEELRYHFHFASDELRSDGRSRQSCFPIEIEILDGIADSPAGRYFLADFSPVSLISGTECDVFVF